jgi:signal recognition particle receptor subunit beta
MVLVSYSGKEINAKLVYYGPGLSGKTTNLEYIYGSIPGTHRGKMVSMKTKTERTLFFDFLPVQLGELSGFKTRFLLYTVPGQVYYNATRKLVLKGVDAVVFVADSKRGKMDENVESLQNLRENLLEHGHKLEDIPFVLQYNKRDLPEVYSISELDQVLNPTHVPVFEAVATSGPGVVETFKAVSKLLLKKLADEIGVPIVGSGKSEGIDLGTQAQAATPVQPARQAAPEVIRVAPPSQPHSIPAAPGATPSIPAPPARAIPLAQSSPAPPIPASPPARAQQPAAPPGPPQSILGSPPIATSKPSIIGSSAAPATRPAGSAFSDATSAGKGAWTPQGDDPGESSLRIERHEVSFDPPAVAGPRDAGSSGGFTGSMGIPVHSAPARSPLPDSPETEESRNTGVAARLRKWLKRDDAADGSGAPEAASQPGERASFVDERGDGAPEPAPAISAGPELRTAVARAFDSAPHASEPARPEGDRRVDHGLSVSDRSSERMSDRREELRASEEIASPGPRKITTASTGAREITVPVELTPEDLESGVVIRLAVRLQESLEDDGGRRRAA